MLVPDILFITLTDGKKKQHMHKGLKDVQDLKIDANDDRTRTGR